MTDVRTIEHDGPRIETGATQIGDDWPGVFIRGDNAAHYAFALRLHLAGQGDVITESVLRGLAKLLASSRLTGEQTNDAG